MGMVEGDGGGGGGGGGRQVVHIKGNKLSAAIKFMADEPVRRAIWRHLPLHTFSLRLLDGARAMECFLIT